MKQEKSINLAVRLFKKIKLYCQKFFVDLNINFCCLAKRLRDECAQGTTEYAILVGVLVVIAILAIAIFRPKLEELWNAIADGINGL